MKTDVIMGVHFCVISPEETITLLESWLETNTNHTVVTPNPEGVMQASRNPSFLDAINNADLSLADGIGIIIASRILKLTLKERVRGYDTTMALFELLNKKRKFTAYFLGGKPGVAEQAKKRMEGKYKNLEVVGLHHGFFDKDESIIKEVNKLKPEILLVCMGMPRAEIWARKNKSVSAKITLCIGGTIDIMAGNVKIAPAFFRKIGLEWFYRLITQPSRAKRMLDLPKFLLSVIFRRRHEKNSH